MPRGVAFFAFFSALLMVVDTGYCIAGYVGVRGDGWMDAMEEREMEAWVGMSVCGGRMNK